jgi:hypothetical protein
VSILAEKTKSDYVEQGLHYYEKKAYMQAYNAFSQALFYDKNNSTILFYKIYCLYLASINISENADAYQVISEGITVINENGYKKNEALYFSEDLMKEITIDMLKNISEWQGD